MSTNYRTIPEISWVEFWNNLPEGLQEHTPTGGIDPDPEGLTTKCLTDGKNYLWCYMEDTQTGTISFCRYGGNNVFNMLEQIEDSFGVEVIDEHDERFFANDEEDESKDE